MGTFVGFPESPSGMKLTLGTAWGAGGNGLDSTDVVILKKIKETGNYLYYSEDGTDNPDDDKNRLRMYFGQGGNTVTAAASLPNTAETNFSWKGSARESAKSAYSFGALWSDDNFDLDSWNTAYFGTSKSYNNDIITAIATADPGGLTVSQGSVAHPNDSDHVAYTELLKDGDSDFTWTITFDNNSDGEIIINSVTTPSSPFVMHASNAIVAGLEIGAAETQDLMVSFDISAASTTQTQFLEQQMVVDTSKGVYYVNLAVMWVGHLTNYPDDIKVTLGTAFKGTYSLTTSDVVTLKRIYVKPSESAPTCGLSYSETGSMIANQTNNRLQWAVNSTSAGSYAYLYNVFYAPKTATASSSYWTQCCYFKKANWSASDTIIENYSWQYWWSVNSGWGSSGFYDNADILDNTGSPFDWNSEIFSTMTSTVGAEAFQLNYDGAAVTTNTGHIHVGTKVLSMVGATLEPIQTVEIEVENTGTEGDLIVHGLSLPNGITSAQSDGFRVGEGSTYTVTLSVADTALVGYYSGELNIIYDSSGSPAEFTVATLSGSVTAQPSDTFIL